MNLAQLVGALLPQAVAIAVSPVGIIAAILLLLTPGRRGVAVWFLVGWIAGVALAVTVFTLLAGVLPSGKSSSPHPIAGIIQIVVGVLLVALTSRSLVSARSSQRGPEEPKWMRAIDKMGAGAAVGLALLLATVNPKNLLMAAGAGVDAGTSGAATGTLVAAIAIYLAVASCGVGLPVAAALIAGKRLDVVLSSTRDWLSRNNATIMGVLVLVLSVVMIGKGLVRL